METNDVDNGDDDGPFVVSSDYVLSSLTLSNHFEELERCSQPVTVGDHHCNQTGILP